MKKTLIYSLFLIFISFFGMSPNYTVLSAPKPLTNEEKQKIANQIKKSNCPQPIKNLYLDQNGNLREDVELYLEGSVIYGYKLDENNNKTEPIALKCVSFSDLEKIGMRIFLFLYSIVGFVLLFSIIKGIIQVILGGTNPEQRQEGYKSIYMPIVYLIGLIFSYFLLVTIFVDVLGVGNPTRKEYSLFCKNTIVFNLIFDRNDPCNDSDPGIPNPNLPDPNIY